MPILWLWKMNQIFFYYMLNGGIVSETVSRTFTKQNWDNRIVVITVKSVARKNNKIYKVKIKIFFYHIEMSKTIYINNKNAR